MVMKKMTFALAGCLMMAQLAFSAPELIGTQDIALGGAEISGGWQKQVALLDYKLSDADKAALAARIPLLKNAGPMKKLPSKRKLQMNNVPVLDQGRHGTCVTFATTAAFDAAWGKGDYISQLCNLTLGNYLEEYMGQPSGWKGSIGVIVLNQMQRYGIIDKDSQHNTGCGGLTEYPREDKDEHGGIMPMAEFVCRHTVLPDTLSWHPVLTVEDAYDPAGFDPDKVLDDTRAAIASGHRVTIGVLVDKDAGGRGGAVAKRKKKYDTWALNDTIIDDVREGRVHTGHALIVTGYKDKEKIDGQKGVLFIRNSWGDKAGNKGNYYMTYDYFKLMVHEVNRIEGPAD